MSVSLFVICCKDKHNCPILQEIGKEKFYQATKEMGNRGNRGNMHHTILVNECKNMNQKG
jgi:hypothetical protein